MFQELSIFSSFSIFFQFFSCFSGGQSGLVPAHARDVPGCVGGRHRDKRDQNPQPEAGQDPAAHPESGGPVGPTQRGGGWPEAKYYPQGLLIIIRKKKPNSKRRWVA